jgi:hypothetical protein
LCFETESAVCQGTVNGKFKARNIQSSFDERVHGELGCDEPVIKWFA